MKLLVNIDQKAALLRGIDAPSSRAEVEYDPADLTHAQRVYLADSLSDGYKSNITVVEPTLDAVLDVLSNRMRSDYSVYKSAATEHYAYAVVMLYVHDDATTEHMRVTDDQREYHVYVETRARFMPRVAKRARDAGVVTETQLELLRIAIEREHAELIEQHADELIEKHNKYHARIAEREREKQAREQQIEREQKELEVHLLPSFIEQRRDGLISDERYYSELADIYASRFADSENDVDWHGYNYDKRMQRADDVDDDTYQRFCVVRDTLRDAPVADGPHLYVTNDGDYIVRAKMQSFAGIESPVIISYI